MGGVTAIRPGLAALSRNLPQIVEDVRTPVYVYDWATLGTSLALILDSADRAGIGDRCTFYLALFALPNLTLFERVLGLDERLGITCNTPEEIAALGKLGWAEWERVVFSGGVLPAADLEAVASTGCLVHVASCGNLRNLLQRLPESRFGLRLDLTEDALKGIRVPDELDWCLQELSRTGRQVRGLHAYPGTEVHDLARLTRHADRLVEEAARMPGLQEVNFGGGFWYDYDHATGDLSEMVEFERYFRHVRDLVGSHLPSGQVRLAWEPGRVAFAGAGFFVTRVLEVRKTGPNTIDVYVDASFTQLPSPKIRERLHKVVLLEPSGATRGGKEYDARICGATTLSTDELLPPDRQRRRPVVPMPEVGDFLVVLDVGAYGHAGSYNFLGKARPPEVLQTEPSFEVIRSRQRVDHLLEGLPFAVRW